MKVEVTAAGVSKIIAIIGTVGAMILGAGYFIRDGNIAHAKSHANEVVIQALQMRVLSLELENKYRPAPGAGGMGGVGAGGSLSLTPSSGNLKLGGTGK